MSGVALVLNAIRLALGALRRNKARSVLTVLGILIGIAAVVMVTALAGGASNMVGAELDSFASNAIFINPQPAQASGARNKTEGRLTEGDAKAILHEAVSVAAVTSWLSTSGQVVYGDENAQTMIVGVTLSYFDIRKFKIGNGGNWTESDELVKAKVCVLGATVATNLFHNEDPVGRVVRIGRAPYRVVGVTVPRGSSMFGDDQDDRVLMPVGSFRAHVRQTAPDHADTIMASATSEKTSARAVEQISAILRQRHHISEGGEDDFEVSTQAEFREFQSSITDALALLLIAVAAVSLVVGGIGVMNIMLVSVAERTREIGIRMSIGAREGDILTQFLVEAIVLTMIGGVLGMLLGVGATFGVGAALHWSVKPTPEALGVAVTTSVIIGVAFGLFPAYRAAKLDPIDALRTD